MEEKPQNRSRILEGFEPVPTIWETSQGVPSVAMPEDYGFFDAFASRRFYAATAGGAGTNITTLRNPVRMWADSQVGDFYGEVQDAAWIDSMQIQSEREKRIKGIRSVIGMQEQFLIEDYGPDFLDNIAKDSKSNANLNARLNYALMSSIERRRFEEYDRASNPFTYGASKTMSAALNYVATDLPSTALAVGTAGGSLAVSGLAGLGKLGQGVSLGMKATQGARGAAYAVEGASWSAGLVKNTAQSAALIYRTYGNTIQKAALGANTLEGALSGYAGYVGYNRDQFLLLGDAAKFDDNPWDDIALGTALGFAGGSLGYIVHMKSGNKGEALASVATSNSHVPLDFVLDWQAKAGSSHGELIREMKAIGLDPSLSATLKEKSDFEYIFNAGWRTPQEMDMLKNWVTLYKPTENEFSALVDSVLILETQRGRAFHKNLESIFYDLMDLYGKDSLDIADGKITLKYSENKEAILEALRKGQASGINRTTGRVKGGRVKFKGTNKILSDFGYDDGQIRDIYNFFRTRSGVDELDFHEYIQTNSFKEQTIKSEIDVLLAFAREVELEEIRVLDKHLDLKGILEPDGTMTRKMRNYILQEYPNGISKGLIDDAKMLPDIEHFLGDPITINYNKLFMKTPASARDAKRISDGFNRLIDKLNRSSQFEDSFHLEGWDLDMNGHPQERFMGFIGESDEDLIKEFAQFQNEIAKLRKSEKGVINGLELERIQMRVKQRLVKNDLLRVRLKLGMKADSLNILNLGNLSIARRERFNNGKYPLRTRNELNAGIMRDKISEIEMNPSELNRRISNRWNTFSRIKEVISPDYNEMFSTGYIRELMERSKLQAKIAKFESIVKEIKSDPEAAAKKINALPPEERADVLKVLKKMKTEANKADKRIREIEKGFKERGIDFSEELKSRGVDPKEDSIPPEKIEKINEEANTLFNKDYSIANRNAVTKFLMQKPGIKWIGEAAFTLFKESMNLATGGSARLWFNDMNDILRFSNLIDSPHILRKDYGDIAKEGLMSVQALRNYNSGLANRVMMKMRKAMRDGYKPTKTEFKATIEYLKGDGKAFDKIADPKMKSHALEIADEIALFSAAWSRDLKQVVGKEIDKINSKRVKDGKPPLDVDNISAMTLQDEIENMFYGAFDRSRVLGNSFAIRQKISELVDVRIKDIESRLGITMPSDIKDQWTKSIFESIDPTKGFDASDALSINKMNGYTFTGLPNIEDQINLWEAMKAYVESELSKVSRTLNPKEEELINDFMNIGKTVISDPSFDEFRLQNIESVVADWANNRGLRLSFQAQLSKVKGFDESRTIFSHLEGIRERTHKELSKVSTTGEVTVNLPQKFDEDMKNLQTRMAHALGFTIESEGLRRDGYGEAFFRLSNGLVRAKVGSMFGLGSMLTDLPKGIILNLAANRLNIFKTVQDFVGAISSRDQLDDLGFALEQYSRMYSIGFDNEGLAGSMAMTTPFGRYGPITQPLPLAQGNLKDTLTMKTTREILTGKVIDPRGAAVRVARQRGTPGGSLPSRVLDLAVNKIESLADFNVRIGGQQYVSAMARDLAVSGAKRMLRKEIDNIIKFSESLEKANISVEKDFNKRVKMFEDLAREAGVDPNAAVRLNHHELLRPEDLKAIRKAMEGKGVIGSRGLYDGYKLLENIESEVGGETRDRIARSLSSWLHEEANTALNNPSLISANPNAGLVIRFLTQFGGFARAFQHYTILRGANQSSMTKAAMMLIPMILGGFAYTEAKKLVSGRADRRGEFGADVAWDDIKRKWSDRYDGINSGDPREISKFTWELMSQQPVFGGIQGTVLNLFINPFMTESEIAEPIARSIGFEQREMRSFMPSYGLNLWSPFKDIYDITSSLTQVNPYEKGFVFGADPKLFNFVPGVRSWEFQAGLRLLEGQGYDPAFNSFGSRPQSSQFNRYQRRD